MDDLTVLSPHRDDAVFSLYTCLSRWQKAPVRVTVLNFFTQSAYAPRALPFTWSSVSALRAREDLRALHAIDGRIRIASAGLTDAPLRFGIEASKVCSPETRSYDDSSDLRTLRTVIRAHFAAGVAIAPLGLGNHVDHLLVSKAATQVLPAHRLAFYEDLPYATWTSEADLKRRVSEREQELCVRLKPVIIRAEHATWRKRAAGVRYQSQITPSEAAAIARFGAKYGGGERIWIPRYSTRWISLADNYA
jgi:LmbE family N-acetylglucosaminyl deacetylase